MVKVLVVLIIALLFNYASAAQLDADISSTGSQIEPKYKFLRILYIDYPQGGDLANALDIGQKTISFSADSQTPGVLEMIKHLNDGLRDSNTRVTDLNISYQAKYTSNEKTATIEYNIEVVPSLANYILLDGSSVYVDAQWRGFKITEPAFIETSNYGKFDINNPSEVVRLVSPASLELVQGSNALKILNQPLLDASGLSELPLEKWHSLFDPTGKQSQSKLFGYENSVFTRFSMGECTLETGVCKDKKSSITFMLDKEYKIRSIESQDDATISIAGYVTPAKYADRQVLLIKEESGMSGSTPEFTVSIIYGMAGLAAVGAVAFFVFSNRKIKNEKTTGQTGIDPSMLSCRETSDSAGSYKTNRGESYLMTNDYDTRPVSKSPI